MASVSNLSHCVHYTAEGQASLICHHNKSPTIEHGGCRVQRGMWDWANTHTSIIIRHLYIKPHPCIGRDLSSTVCCILVNIEEEKMKNQWGANDYPSDPPLPPHAITTTWSPMAITTTRSPMTISTTWSPTTITTSSPDPEH